jgi:hypothetical protein
MLDRPVGKTGRTNVAFGDVVRKVNDKVDPWDSGLERYVAGEHMDTDDLRIRRWGLIGEDYLGPAFHMRFNPAKSFMALGGPICTRSPWRISKGSRRTQPSCSKPRTLRR